MNAKEIRDTNWEVTAEIRGTNWEVTAYLREIAAQLAKHNAHLERLEWLAENVISLNCGGLQVKVNQ